jgi:hypothetical protein
MKSPLSLSFILSPVLYVNAQRLCIRDHILILILIRRHSLPRARFPTLAQSPGRPFQFDFRDSLTHMRELLTRLSVNNTHTGRQAALAIPFAFPKPDPLFSAD